MTSSMGISLKKEKKIIKLMTLRMYLKLEKSMYVPTLDNYGQSCFVRNDFLKMKCVCKTQMMPPSDH